MCGISDASFKAASKPHPPVRTALKRLEYMGTILLGKSLFDGGQLCVKKNRGKIEGGSRMYNLDDMPRSLGERSSVRPL